MEALKHTEWTFGVIFFWFALFSFELKLFWLLIILVGSQLPDFLEITLIQLGFSDQSARKMTHDYAIVVLLWFLFPFDSSPEINLFTTALAVHYLIDLFSGLEPVYIGGFIFGERTAVLYVTAEHRMRIGRRIEKWGSNYLTAETEHPTPELAWFWVMQVSGAIFCGLGILTYIYVT